MSETLIQSSGTKTEKYESIIPQIQALVGTEKDLVANLGNVCAALRMTFSWFWTGFYLVKEKNMNQNELVLSAFQGDIACTRIAFGRGVCGTAWKEKKSQLVPDVDAFPGHIACSTITKSELVIPIVKNDTVVAVLDLDSEKYAHFDEIDRVNLEKLCKWLGENIF